MQKLGQLPPPPFEVNATLHEATCTQAYEKSQDYTTTLHVGALCAIDQH